MESVCSRLRFGRRFRGPPGAANGGFASGPRQQSSAPREEFSHDLDDEIPF